MERKDHLNNEIHGFANWSRGSFSLGNSSRHTILSFLALFVSSQQFIGPRKQFDGGEDGPPGYKCYGTKLRSVMLSNPPPVYQTTGKIATVYTHPTVVQWK